MYILAKFIYLEYIRPCFVSHDVFTNIVSGPRPMRRYHYEKNYISNS